ncbi:MAG: 3-hydroxyacyl-ACP dehydratase FabZ [Alphaproteobacteria bacterium]|jgi:3-hydroxyacyl-[acyl-carrier-protein] dehydratase|nr:3-hydroxyacyl-ACP dehydratase FabZ [Rickettsiales bacterium]
MTNKFQIDKNLPILDCNNIKELIPHRYPFLLVDRIVNIVPGERAVGIKNVTSNEPHFPGHFPNHPVMPGVLIIECMAQTTAALVVHTLGDEAKGKVVYFMSIDEARFRKPVVPGDVLRVHCQVVRHRGAVWKFTAEAMVDDMVVAEATYAAMIMNEKGA